MKQSIVMTRAQHDKAERIGDGNVSEGVRTAITAYPEDGVKDST